MLKFQSFITAYLLYYPSYACIYTIIPKFECDCLAWLNKVQLGHYLVK